MLAAIGLVKLPKPKPTTATAYLAELQGCTFEQWEAAGEFYETFHGSFQLGEITRRSVQFPRRHGKSLLNARVEQTVRDLGAYVDRAYTQKTRA